VEVTARVTNRGPRTGAEVVHLYVHDGRPALPRPPQELKGFQRVVLRPGASAEVRFSLAGDAFAYYDPSIHHWRTRPGPFMVRLGTSSRDIRADLPVTLR
jgi:beta-glucosidase